MTVAGRPARAILLTLLGLALVATTGCGGAYALRGRVVAGAFGDVSVLAAEDPALDRAGPPVPGAVVVLFRDPDRLSRARVAEGRSDAGGRIDLPVPAFGAGWMDEQWLIRVVRDGYQTLETFVRLPAAGRDERLLITLVEGFSQPPQDEDLWDEAERFRR